MQVDKFNACIIVLSRRLLKIKAVKMHFSFLLYIHSFRCKNSPPKVIRFSDINVEVNVQGYMYTFDDVLRYML